MSDIPARKGLVPSTEQRVPLVSRFLGVDVLSQCGHKYRAADKKNDEPAAGSATPTLGAYSEALQHHRKRSPGLRARRPLPSRAFQILNRDLAARLAADRQPPLRGHAPVALAPFSASECTHAEFFGGFVD